MSKAAEALLGISDYESRKTPYVVEQLGQIALQTLIAGAHQQRQILSGEVPEEDVAEVLDPHIVELREQAEILREQAEDSLASAKEVAVQIKETAQKEAAQIKIAAKEEGYQEGLASGSEEGYEAGEKKGQEEGLRQWAETVARWQSILEATVAEKDQYLVDRKEVLVKLVFETAAKVLHRELTSDPSTLLVLIKAAISKVSDRSKLVLHLNPEDLEQARDADEAVLNITERIKQIEFQADETVSRGGVRIEAGSETIDASLDMQLARIARGLMETASDDRS